MDNATLYNRIRKYAARIPLSDEAISKRIVRKNGKQADRSFVRNLKKNPDQDPGADALRQIARIVGCTVEDLLKEDEPSAASLDQSEWLAALSGIDDPKLRRHVIDVAKSTAKLDKGGSVTGRSRQNKAG